MGQRWAVSLAARIALFAAWLFVSACAPDSEPSSSLASGPDASVGLGDEAADAETTSQAKALAFETSLETAVWELRTSPPGPRKGLAGTFDSARSRVVLFGGKRGLETLGDTWEWDGAVWTRRAVTGPVPRAFSSVAFDPIRNKVVLFGGEYDSELSYGDTWEWDGVAWKEVCPFPCAHPTPPARSHHGMFWDPVNQMVVVFGGRNGNGHLNDTWGFTGQFWIRLDLFGTLPAPREDFGLAWDTHASKAVLFGGRDASQDFGDTWTWNGIGWLQRSVSGPSARSGMSLAYDGVSRKVVGFGGLSGPDSLTAYDETWRWDDAASSWQRATTETQPITRYGALVAHDSGRNRAVLFGGDALSKPAGDTWEWDGGNWRKINAYPDARTGYRLAYDPGSGKTLLFGGALGWDSSNELWGYGGTRWSRLCTSEACSQSAPSGRGDFAMAFDDRRGRLIVYGGSSAGLLAFDDLWEFTGTLWEEQCSYWPCQLQKPPPRGYPSSGAFDSERLRFVLFGGSFGGADLGDTWEWDGSSWEEKCTSSPCRDHRPSPRREAATVFDPVRKKTILFGGSAPGLVNDLWEWDGERWEEKCTSAECRATAPQLFGKPTLAFDSVRKRLVLFAGWETWEWDGERWASLSIFGPSLRMATALAYDTERQRVVLWGGDGLDDTWEYHTRGGTCQTSLECATGFCVDGVCCESVSCDTCQACNLPSNPGLCESVRGADDVDSCTGTKTCDAQGRCLFKNARLCSDGSTCASGHCADSHCCESACSGGCDVCNVVPGTCTPRASGAVGENPSCGGFLCDGSAGACPLVCKKDGDCDTGHFCAADGSCQPRRTTGRACDIEPGGNCHDAGCRECQDGLTCKDGYCCTSACDGGCESCALEPGTCISVTSSDDPDTCAGTTTCDVTGRCKAKNGQACTSPGDCASGHCVDGFCCNAACAGGCDLCNETPGICTIRSQGQVGREPSCGAFVCNGSSPSCPTICGNDADCLDGFYCAADGSCQARKSQGASCHAESGADCKTAGCRVCESGNCVDGFCCDSACGGSCDACNGAEIGWEGATNGTCHFAPGGYAGSPACVTYACDGTSALCATSCESDVECASGFYCSTNGICLPQKLQGQACNLATDCKTGDCRQCVTGNCVDGLCCNSACPGACETCSATPGTCTPRSAGSLGEPSCAPFFCNGISASCDDNCETDAHCASEHHCAAGKCHPKKGLGESCESDRQCGSVAYCEELTATCVAKSALGEACLVGKACASGFCVDGVCCDQACGGQCEACDVGTAKGKCSPVVGAPHGDRPACEAGSGGSGDALCEARSCDGSKSTASCVGYVGSEVGCRDRSCEAGEETFSATCNGQGQCGPAGATKTRSCEPYACGGTSCKAACEREEDCASGYTCDAKSGKCIAGATCDGDHIITAPGQPPTDCSPYKCEAGGTCKASCASIEDCVSGFVCDLDNHCVPAAFDSAVSSDSGGWGCRMAGRGPDASGGWLALALMGLVGARLGWRRRD